MKKLLLIVLIYLSSAICAQENIAESKLINLNHYLEYLKKYPKTLGPFGNADNGEIEIIHDKQKILQIEEATNREVGVISQDNYWIWLNDAVKFPNKKYGVYGRILWKRSLEGIGGVAIMPILPNGKILLNLNYRHATRSWEFEIPRGCLKENESIEDAAKRELKEETGYIANNLYYLGEILPDSGMTNTVVTVFLAKVIRQEKQELEDSEAIHSIEAFNISELKQGFIDGV